MKKKTHSGRPRRKTSFRKHFARREFSPGHKASPAPGKKSRIEVDPANAGGDFSYILERYDFPSGFDKRCRDEAARACKKNTAPGERLDLTAENIITIDGETARDFDDAVSINTITSGFLLGVHIADVSHYIAMNSWLDREAQKRGNSVYLLDQVIPMLPEELSNDLCSLVEGKPRLTCSCFMHISMQGKILSYDFKKSLIKSRKRCTYREVQDILDGKKADTELESLLAKASVLARLLGEKRLEFGSIDFETDEQQITLDAKGFPVEIKRKQRLFSEQIIEEFMLCANICAAEKLTVQKTGIFRVHDAPDEKKIRTFLETVHDLGYRIKEAGHKNRYQAFLENITDEERKRVLSTLLLHCMKQAKYSVNNTGHYGLGFPRYTHFTSPIRRCSDLIVHRMLFADSGRLVYSADELEKIAEKTSLCERTAVEAERDLYKIKSARFMAGLIGKIFNTVVSGIIPRGIFVQDPATGIEGFVSAYAFPESSRYNEEKKIFQKKDGSPLYFTGDRIRVKLIKVNTARCFIDFVPVESQKFSNRHF
ncbi:MAG: hypothetical protein A2096_03945 [Spirochaetes bacterium GWF1_41_5]|nr:MAG: hypothetical protein A2096_03945 [Spirochaetes bacterium GWF1_41_5]